MISSVFFALVAGFFLSRVGVPAWYEWLNPVMMVMIVGLSYVPFVRYRWWRGWYVLFMLGLTAVIIEYIAIKTCVPYGCFVYTDQLWYKLLDTVPWTVLFGWTPLVMMIDSLLQLYKKQRSSLSQRQYFLLGAMILVICDVMLDPWAVRAWFWVFGSDYGFSRYNVPWVNFVWWIVSWVIGMRELDLRKKYLTKQTSRSYDESPEKQWWLWSWSGLVMMMFWVSYAIWEEMWWVVVVACVTILLVYLKKREK